jgi:hypothetical protein
MGKALLELCQLNRQQRETLADVIMELSGDSAAFLLLRLDQLAAQARESRFRQLALRNVYECDHRTYNLLPSPLRMAPVFSRETRPIRPPKQLVVCMDSFSCARRLENSRLLDRQQFPVSRSLMNQRMHIPTEELVKMFILQRAEAGRVAKRAAALKINPINGLSGRIENQPEFVLALTQLCFGSSLSGTLPEEFKDEEALHKH